MLTLLIQNDFASAQNILMNTIRNWRGIVREHPRLCAERTVFKSKGLEELQAVKNETVWVL